MSNVFVSNHDDLLNLLDALLEKRDSDWWTSFYRDPNRKCPFFTLNPNEDLAELINIGTIKAPLKVLELGCGNGRNAIYLAKQGFTVDAVDFSQGCIDQALRNAGGISNLRFHCQSIFDFSYAPSSYDFIYDCGCFHHIPPHRRPGFMNLITSALRPGGIFSIACFAPGGGSDFTDTQVYEKRSMGGGLSFSRENLLRLFSPHFEILSFRKMREMRDDDAFFGKDFMHVMTMRKTA